MTDRGKGILRGTAAWVGTLGGLGGLIAVAGSVWIPPYRVEALERKVEHMSSVHERDHELLMRIEERLINLQRSVEPRNRKDTDR